MKNLSIPQELQEKLYDQKFLRKKTEITSFFPLDEHEKQLILKNLENYQVSFKSIFSDSISKSEWIKTKEQIKKKFHKELFNLD